MANKKVKFLGITVYKKKTKGNKTRYKFLGIPFASKIKKNLKDKYYFFGIRVFIKRFKEQKNEVIVVKNKIKVSKDRKKLNIAIQFDGGVGDYLISSDFVYLLRQYIGYEVKIYIENILF